MLARWTRLLLVAALFGAADAPLALVQGYAWATMAWRAARQGETSIARTLDGSHPCAVCLAVKNAAHGPSVRASAPLKLDLVHQPAFSLRTRTSAVASFEIASPSCRGRAAPPPVPPPDQLS